MIYQYYGLYSRHTNAKYAPISMRRTPNKDDGIQNLVQRLDMALDTPGGRVIVFISARPSEGVSTVARDYALALADSADHDILLIDAGKLDQAFYDDHEANSSVAIADTVANGKPVQDAIYFLATHVHFGRWASSGRGRAAASKLVKDQDFWANLHKSFGTIVIDAPSLKESPDGISLAARANATVLVVEAETTRQPVVENLRDTLDAAGAKIVGVVMNKRRYYIPSKVYQNM